MTDFEKVKSYYSVIDEWGRLDDSGGKLEFELTMSIITSHLPRNADILDLGGGPGRYTIELARLGHSLHLADLSQSLLDVAKKKIAEFEIENVKSITQVNAVDLSVYADSSFDAVLLLGPLYHLTDETERHSCIKEVRRVLKENGVVFAAFIPYLAGAIGTVNRMFNSPEKVNVETLKRVFEHGVFNNLVNWGWQEAYYPTSDELISLFSINGFSKILLRSIRGWGCYNAEQILKLKDENLPKYEAVIELINKTADNPSIIEMCEHAIYIGQKSGVHE
jgi:ubiquinone/menaquinone biosynthesis C-methylase UbiE